MTPRHYVIVFMFRTTRRMYGLLSLKSILITIWQSKSDIRCLLRSTVRPKSVLLFAKGSLNNTLLNSFKNCWSQETTHDRSSISIMLIYLLNLMFDHLLECLIKNNTLESIEVNLTHLIWSYACNCPLVLYPKLLGKEKSKRCRKKYCYNTILICCYLWCLITIFMIKEKMPILLCCVHYFPDNNQLVHNGHY